MSIFDTIGKLLGLKDEPTKGKTVSEIVNKQPIIPGDKQAIANSRLLLPYGDVDMTPEPEGSNVFQGFSNYPFKVPPTQMPQLKQPQVPLFNREGMPLMGWQYKNGRRVYGPMSGPRTIDPGFEVHGQMNNPINFI